MASVVDICNDALASIGADLIMNLEEERKAARLCKQKYEKARNAVLRAHPWNCALARTSLAMVSAKPAFGYSVQFQLPADCLRVVQAYRADKKPIAKWQIEGRKLLTDEEQAYIKYIRKIEDPNLFDSLCREAIAARLAAMICYAMTQSQSLTRLKWKEYFDILVEARAIDAQEGTVEDETTDSWISVRR